MKITATLVSIFILHLCITNTVEGQHFADDSLAAHTTLVSQVAYRDRRNKAEPTCEELRAMWRYSKRQSRSAEITNDLPMYRDPFSYNVWETYPIRSQSSFGYRGSIFDLDEREEQTRHRGGGRAPVYGKMVHKAPAESRLRNGMPNRIKAFEEVARMYGTINRQPLESRRPQYSFRVGGGSSHVPQAGSFQHLKELIRTERARELQDQRIAEEMAARAAAMNDITKERRRVDKPDSRLHNINSLQSYQESKNANHHVGPSQYIPSLSSFSNNLLRSDDYNRDPMIH